MKSLRVDMAGRPRKPTARHLVEGTTTHRDRLNLNEPQYPVVAPDKPEVVAANETASAEWDRIVPELLAQRTIGRVSLSGLVAYCLAFARVIDVERDPASTIKERIDCATSLRQADSALGITPTTAGKVSSAPAAQAPSALAEIQEKRRALRAAFKTV
jgi:phage terminase small subunit